MRRKVSLIICALVLILSFSAQVGAIGFFGGIAADTAINVLKNTTAALEISRDIPQEEFQEVTPRGGFAYAVSATQRYNIENENYYLELWLINETGGFEVVTVDNVEDYHFMPLLTEGRIGRISEWSGAFVKFNMGNTDKIQRLDTPITEVSQTFAGADGLYLVNVIDERNGVVWFYDTDSDVDISAEQARSLVYHEDGHAVIAIDGDGYRGDALATVSGRETSLFAGEGNAVIQVYEGEILRVFSFYDGFSAD